jgi:hypothetical protein
MAVQRAKESTPPPAPTMTLSAAQGRFGVDYLQLVCSHAGFGCNEPRPGEDVRAIDATIGFEYGDAHVQVKCTTKAFSPKRQTIRIPVEDDWVTSWQKLRVRGPIYLVVVQVREQATWIDYPASHTLVSATAYWAAIDPAKDTKSLVVHRDQQLTVNTLREWALERQLAVNGKAA